MTEIPDDIPEDVVRLARKYSMSDDVLVAVCRAILAERERCAKVAYAYADSHSSDHKMISHIIGRKILFDTIDDGS